MTFFKHFSVLEFSVLRLSCPVTRLAIISFYVILSVYLFAGYIVHCSERRSHGCLYLRFLVQSERSLEHVERRIETFVASAHNMLRDMSSEEFERNKQAVIQRLRVKPKKLSGQAEHFWAEIVTQDYNFDRRTYFLLFYTSIVC